MDDFYAFVTEHLGDNADKLRMKFRNDTRKWLPMAINHIEAYKRGRRKFPNLPSGWIFPSILAVEQSTPSNTARYNFEVTVKFLEKSPSDSRILDMTAGLGMDALEFAKAGVNLDLIELNPAHAMALELNFNTFKNATVFNDDSVEWLRNYNGEPFDVIFVDPARRESGGGRVYNLHQCQPDLIELLPLILSKGKVCVAKLSPMLDISKTFNELPQCCEIHVVEEAGECRELLAVIPGDKIRKNTDKSMALFNGHGVVVHKESDTWRYDFDNVPDIDVIYGCPEAGSYILLPSPAVVKGLPSKLICSDGVRKVAPSSNVYFADSITTGGLGRWCKVESVDKMSGAKVRQIGKRVGKAEVISRNVKGMTSDALRVKLGVGESAQKRIIATTTSDGTRIIIVGEPV